MKKITSSRRKSGSILGLSSIVLLVTACSPVDSVRTLDQQQTENLVRNMYPVETSSQLVGISKRN